jgi:hypothetical protein
MNIVMRWRLLEWNHQEGLFLNPHLKRQQLEATIIGIGTKENNDVC